ncbi:hypothetical protein HDU79_001672 [Rhizoclosmatium sp. JEL0117]|nr:hypothetical protein HDU79_001672 [Rhizoclosmatium sp. JEL0117]
MKAAGQLRSFNVGVNLFQNGIPDLPTVLTYLNLSRNRLTGSIPILPDKLLTSIKSDPTHIDLNGNCFDNAKSNSVLQVNNSCTSPSSASKEADTASGNNIGVIIGGAIGGLLVLALLSYGAFRLVNAKRYYQKLSLPFRTSDSPSNQQLDQPQTIELTLPIVNSDTSSSSYRTFVSEGGDAVPEKARGTLFDAMNSMSVNMVQTSTMNYKFVEPVEENGQMDWFGELRLPALPSKWSIQHVKAWAAINEATPTILDLIERGQLDGRTFLMTRVDDFTFPTMGHMVRFRTALENLRSINEQRLRLLNEPAPPGYPGESSS